MICSVLKRKESIKSVTPSKGLTIISKLRTSLHEYVEKLLMVWVTEKQLQGDTLTQTIICEKARAIYGDLLKQTPQTSIDEASEESFKASRGTQFVEKKNTQKKLQQFGDTHTKLDILRRFDKGEKAVEIAKAVGLAATTVRTIRDQDGDKIREAAKFASSLDAKMMTRTRSALVIKMKSTEKSAPGFKASKDRLTLLLGGNANGDFKFKPFLIYKSENPRAMKGCSKNLLPVHWRANKKAWMTTSLFKNWVTTCAIPEIKAYCIKENLNFKALVLVDNAPSHPVYVDELSER
ncbi:hypothetical protein LAZ67_2000925 [Cordylochernes scorpioides]|uniref:Transposase n=1 Tax=Cordylochernes scorpioides TaxID=51811 RepID=A0ABY6K0S9_9ARAC|nr:hypothetical protein LAZ67_2000925 [Cordylochernes scorpioides]